MCFENTFSPNMTDIFIFLIASFKDKKLLIFKVYQFFNHAFCILILKV